MKKKLFLFSLAIIFISAPLFALNRVLDGAGLLNDYGVTHLQEMLDEISVTYDFDLVVLTVTATGGAEPEDYANDFYVKNGYGLGKDKDGCLLLVVTDERVFWFSASGRGKEILTSTATKKLEKEINYFFGKRGFYSAFVAFAENWEKFLVLDARGRHYNFFYKNNLALVIIAWVVSLGIGFLIVMIWKKSMNTVIPKKQAAAYITPGSLSFAVQQDQFLYSMITKIERESDLDDDEDEDEDTNANLPKKAKAGNSEDQEDD